MRFFLYVSAVAVLLGIAPAAFAADSARATMTVTAQFSSRTSLKLSGTVLQFEVAAPDQPATASVDFSAAARTHERGEVLLSVERDPAIERPCRAADGGSRIELTGEGDFVIRGALAPTGPTVAGRWIGSGVRTGRLAFVLRALVTGTCTVPVRFVLSAP